MKTRHLSRAQKATLRQALVAKRSQLVREVEQLEDERLDAEAVIEDRHRMALEEHDRVVLEDVEHALAKLEAGTYGVSEATGRPIPFERLMAIPWARDDARQADGVERASRS